MRFVLLLLAGLLLVPAIVTAAPPEPMVVSGTLTVNGAPAPSGTPIAARTPGSEVLATASVEAEGAFRLVVPGDDPETGEVEGAREGEPIEFHALGGRAPAPVAFLPGGQRVGVALVLSLPDLVVVAVDAEPSTLREGENVTISGAIANRGRVAARLVRIVVSDGASPLASDLVGEVPPNATVGFSLALGTAGLGGNRSLRVQALASNGDADPATDVGFAGIAVETNRPPVVRDLRRLPPAPGDGEPVLLHLDAEDEDGIGRVEFRWTAGAEERTALVLAPPWQASIGAFPAGTSIRYRAVVTDASPLARSTTTPLQVFEIRAADPTPAPSVEAPGPEAPASPQEAPWPGLGAVGATVALAALGYRRRRT